MKVRSCLVDHPFEAIDEVSVRELMRRDTDGAVVLLEPATLLGLHLQVSRRPLPEELDREVGLEAGAKVEEGDDRIRPHLAGLGDDVEQRALHRDLHSLAAHIPAKTDEEIGRIAPSFFPNLTQAAAKAKLEADLPAVAAQFHGSTQNAGQIFQQRALTDAFLEARANLSSADGDTFAMMRAETQAKNTYTSISQQAMTWVPLLNIVLVVVFYAMFPVIFPLFLMPQTGVQALKGYLTGFFYLAAWGPLYAVLHMFIMGREESAMAATAPGGITMSTIEGIDAVNADTATIAGFLMMSIPFLAGGLAKGAMTISSQATSMLAPAQSAAEAAAIERTTGNYSYGKPLNCVLEVVDQDEPNENDHHTEYAIPSVRCRLEVGVPERGAGQGEPDGKWSGNAGTNFRVPHLPTKLKGGQGRPNKKHQQGGKYDNAQCPICLLIPLRKPIRTRHLIVSATESRRRHDRRTLPHRGRSRQPYRATCAGCGPSF